MNRIPFPILIILAVIIGLSVIGFVMSLIGLITGMIWRFVFSPIGIISIIVLIIYLVYGRKK
ncbi:MAG: hypothetical protein FWC75_00860 [Oscillospiraceae bacterium]|nr:hypothetical protein [Oscillospiraceae bacterium]